MTRTYFLILFFTGFLSSTTAQYRDKGKSISEFKATVDSVLNSAVALDKIPGAVVRIQQNGKTVYEHAYGYSQVYDINHHRLPHPPLMNTNTLFDLASLTKVIGTTTSIMLLADRGLIHIDDPVGKYIHGFDTLPKSEITIRNLLTHTAGLYEWYPLFYRSSRRKNLYYCS